MVKTIIEWGKWIWINPHIHPCLILFIAAFCGGALGTERQKSGHTEAGRRTLALVALGGCIFTILPMLHTKVSDPWRMGAQVITGIGFIGAGVLIKEGFTIKGLTTASTIWVSAAIGVCFGAEEILLGFFSTIFSLMILLTSKLENKNGNRINHTN